jgi:hypothetical protein
MRKRLSPEIFSRSIAEIKANLRSWMVAERNGWYIKLSIYKDENILLMFVSKHTAQTIIRYFNCEDEAVKFINFVIEQNAEEMLQQ